MSELQTLKSVLGRGRKQALIPLWVGVIDNEVIEVIAFQKIRIVQLSCP